MNKKDTDSDSSAVFGEAAESPQNSRPESQVQNELYRFIAPPNPLIPRNNHTDTEPRAHLKLM